MMGGTHAFLRTERVHFGPGSLRKIEEEARPHGRAFVVTGRTLDEKTYLVRRVEALLGEKHAGTHVGMGEHTPGSAVELAAGEAESAGADLLVSVGGGSVIDGTKAVARQLGYPAQVAVPTTLSGAEWAHRVGVTDEAAGKKAGFADPGAVPPVVILDPDATIFTPERLWLSTGIRALDHAVEGFLYGGDHPVTDVTGLEGARRLMGLLPLSRAKPDDLGARAELQVAAWLSYFGPLNTPMGLSHGLGRRIGASYNVPHGVTSCITLAPSLEVARETTPKERWLRLSDALGGDPPKRVTSLVAGLGLPRRLRDVGVPEGEFEEIADGFGGQKLDALRILNAAY
jgi:alcohol dehydrogenase class IV